MDQANVKEDRDEDEIDLDDDDDDDEGADDKNQQDQPATTAAAVKPDVAAAKEEEVQDDPAVEDNKQKDLSSQEEAPPEQAVVAVMSKSAAMKQRLRQLKQKMNQARHLNQQAVKQEGERMGSHEAQSKEKRRVRAMDKQSAAQHLASTNSKALQLAAQHDIQPKFLLQQASESVQKAQARLESQERNQYSVNDTYNPEGQHRNYQNSLKQLPRGGKQQQSQHSMDRLRETFDPLQHQLAVAAASGSSSVAGIAATDRPFLNVQQERHGARRLAQEMHKRLEINKKKETEKKRKLEIQEEQQHEDVGFINQRNKRFNQKINRTYGKDTAEIKQNLERGTAL